MTAPSPPDLPANARFINAPTMHQPTGYTHVVEVTEGRPIYIAGQIALDRRAHWLGRVTSGPRHIRCSRTSRLPSKRSASASSR